MLHPLILLAGVCAVGSGALFARVGLDAGTSALTLAVWRLTIAAVLLGAWRLARRREATPFDRSDHLRLAVAGFCLALHFFTWLASLRYVSVARSTLLVSTTPVWAGLLGLAIPSMRPGRRFWIGLAIAATGVVLVTTQGIESPTGTFAKPAWVGDLTATLGAIFILPYLLLSQEVQKKFGTEATVSWIYGWAAASLWIIALFLGEAKLPLGAAGWISAAGMAVLPQMVGHTIFNWSLRHFTAGQVAAATLLEPVFAGILAVIFLSEGITFLQAIGGIVLLAGVAITLRKQDAPVAAEAG